MATKDIDLAALARTLGKRRQHPELQKKIKQAISVASAFQDLKAAREALDELKNIHSLREGSERVADYESVVGSALFAHAIILYARATDTKPASDERWKWFGRDMLTEGKRVWHKEVMDYRNQVLAHFGHGEKSSSGPSVKNALVMREPPPDTREIEFAYIESRAGTKAHITAMVSLLVDETLQIARARYNERLAELYDALNSIAGAEAALPLLAQSHKFDSSEFFGDLEGVDLNSVKDRSYHFIKPVP